MNIPIPGATYRQNKSEKLYTVEGCLTIKIDNEWIENGVTVYVSDETRKTYARLTEDFMSSFCFVRED